MCTFDCLLCGWLHDCVDVCEVRCGVHGSLSRYEL